MLLSACMIIKDEEWTIRKCLESVVGIVDEIVIVDTGSTDASIEIAQSLGAKVHRYEWKHDFAQARNESLQHASGDYILYIDADEYLDEDQKLGIREFLSTQRPDAVMVRLRNYVGTLDHMIPMVPIPVTRIFKRGYTFSGAIHEQILSSIETQNGVIKEYALTVHHVGYLKEFVARKGKSDRNMEILKAELSRDPGNFFHQTNLLAEYVRVEDYSQADRLSSQIVHSLRRHPPQKWPYYSARVFSHRLTALERLDLPTEAQKLAREAMNLFPRLPEFRKRYAAFLIRQLKYTEALRELAHCREIGEQTDATFDMLEGYGSYYAALDLGTVWLELGDQLNARKWFIQAFVENPHLEMSIIPILCLMPAHAQILRDHFESRLEDIETYGTYAEIYAAMRYPEAQQVIARAEGRFGPSGLTMRARLALLLMHGGLAEIELFVKKYPLENNRLMLGLTYWEQGSYALAQKEFDEAGIRGQEAAALMETDRHLLSTGEIRRTDHPIALLPLFRDMSCMHTEGIIKRMAPLASDLKEIWHYLKIGPFKDLSSQMTWSGDSLHECEDNALQAFTQKDLTKCEQWLQKAERYQTTVRTTLLRCDLSLAQGDVTKARRVLFRGKELFPDSEMIKVVSPQVFAQVAES